MPTKIEWADESWNPVTGCTKISEGCKNCYAERMAKRLAGRFGYSVNEPFRVTWHEDKLQKPFNWRKPRRVFVCSMGDLFHPDVETYWIKRVFWMMMSTSNTHHVFLVLTKRPQRMRYILRVELAYDWDRGNPPSNIWLGVSVENQKRADERIPILLDIPAAVRFVSCEPLLGTVNIRQYLPQVCAIHQLVHRHGRDCLKKLDRYGLDWVIVGAETGPKARPVPLDLLPFRIIRDACQDAKVPAKTQRFHSS